MQIYTEQNPVRQSKNFWAKMTKFNSGLFELSVIEPRNPPEHRDAFVTAPKGCAVSFAGKPVYDAPAPLQRARKVRSDLTEEQRKEKDNQNLVRTVRRARQRVRLLVKGLQASHMVTLSYRENMEDIERLKSDSKRFIRMVRTRYPEWQYIAIRERQDRGALHLHMAVKGRQDIRWLLRCWLLAIGQDWEEVQQWYVHDKALGVKSLGAVHVRAPSKRWGGSGQSWKPEKLAGYLTKYLGKEFQNLEEHYSMRYWHSRGIEKPVVMKFWLGATNFHDAIVEAHDLVHDRGAKGMSMWSASDWCNLWISGGGLIFDID